LRSVQRTVNDAVIERTTGHTLVLPAPFPL
jgi:hypothetical protein